MMPRTAMSFIKDEVPFTQIATTRRFMATTAMLVALKYLDLSEREGTVRDVWIYDDELPNGFSSEPTSLEDSVDMGLFKVSDVLTTREGPGPTCKMPFKTDPDRLLRILMGTTHQAQCRPAIFSAPIVTDADQNDWRMVEIQQLGDDEEGVKFYDIPTLRNATVVKLKQPRVGFMTMPAFLGRYETNADNSFRVTTNQALIVALGEAIEDENFTVPDRTGPLEEEHAQPGTTCYQCHVMLDPMRNYFRNDFDINYRKPEERLADETSFGFGGETVDGGGMDTFAQALANHPDFARGWAMKLCRWATSMDCRVRDPEFRRVVTAFEESNFSFRTLFREMMASPLVTGAAETETQEKTAGTIVSIARQAHLCNALSVRLEVPNVCKENRVARVLGVIPADQFGRGATSPMLPSTPNLMLSGGTDVVCTELAALLVDREVAGQRRFGLRDADRAQNLSEMVTKIMAIPPEDSRFGPMLAELNSHFDEARAVLDENEALNNNQKKRLAMRSAFRLACQSPTALSLGN